MFLKIHRKNSWLIEYREPPMQPSIVFRAASDRFTSATADAASAREKYSFPGLCKTLRFTQVRRIS
jgi:hypothetical protein